MMKKNNKEGFMPEFLRNVNESHRKLVGLQALS